MPIINIGVGFIMLLAGRPAYATFVGGTAFIAGVYLSERVEWLPAEASPVLVGTLLAILGIIGVFVLRRWMARLASFFAGGYLVIGLSKVFISGIDAESWIIFVISGIIALVAVWVWFDIAMVIVSTLTAVALIIENFPSAGLSNVALFVVLTMVGMITQMLFGQYIQPSPD